MCLVILVNIRIVENFQLSHFKNYIRITHLKALNKNINLCLIIWVGFLSVATTCCNLKKKAAMQFMGPDNEMTDRSVTIDNSMYYDC